MKQFNLLLIATVLCISSFAQNKETADGRFHDDLLDHLVGKWDVTSIAHGFSSTAIINAEWVLNHQYLHVHFKGNEVIPWFGVPMEFEYFISYNHIGKRYVVQGISVIGVDDFEGFCYASRNANELRLIQDENKETETRIIQVFVWQPSGNSWVIQSRRETKGVEGEPFLDMKLTSVKGSSN
jgi:hypothetical protein